MSYARNERRLDTDPRTVSRLAAALRRFRHSLCSFAETLGEIHDLLPRQQEARFTRLTLECQTQKDRIRLGYGCSEARYE